MAGPTLELDISTDGVVRGGRVATNVLDDIAKYAAITASQLHKLNYSFDKNAQKSQKVTRANKKVVKSNKMLEKSFNDAKKSLKGFIAGYLGLSAIQSFTRDAINARLELNRLENSLRTVTGSSAEASKQIMFLRKTAKDLGLDFRAVSGSYGQLLAAAKSVNISTEVTQKLFKNVSAASRALSLTNDQTKGTFLAFSQILSKGKLSMEEIRQQLGERMPVAMKVFADSLGISTEEFQKLVGEGKLYAEDVIPLVADEFGKFTKDAQKASGDLQSKFNELNTAWFDFQTTLLDGKVLDGFKDILSVATFLVEKISQASVALGKLNASSDQAQAKILARMKEDPNMRPGPGGVDLFGGLNIFGGVKRTKVTPKRKIKSTPSSSPTPRTTQPITSSGDFLSSTVMGIPGMNLGFQLEPFMQKRFLGQMAIEAGQRKKAGTSKKKKPAREESYSTPFIDDFFDLSAYADGGATEMVLKDEVEAMQKLEKEGRSLVERYQTVEQRLNATKARAKELRRAGVITEKEYMQISEQISSQFDDLEEKSVESFNVMEQAMQGWANSFTDTFVDALTGAQSSFSGFVNSILKDLLRLSVQQNITKPLFDSLGGGGGFLGKLFGGSKHSGGVVPGRPGEERLMMLQAGERVISNGQNQAMAKSGGMNVNIYNNSGAQVQATQRQGSNGVELDITIDKIVAEKLSSPSRSSSALKNVYGLRSKGY